MLKAYTRLQETLIHGPGNGHLNLLWLVHGTKVGRSAAWPVQPCRAAHLHQELAYLCSLLLTLANTRSPLASE